MNSQPRFDIAVLIGRFQPFHNGHLQLLEHALSVADSVVVVLGSSFQARNAKNPFTWEERAAMISATLAEATASRVSFAPVRDYYDDRKWSAAVTAAVCAPGRDKPQRIALVGFHKDASSYYLGLFPHWAFVPAPEFGKVNATTIRQQLYEQPEQGGWRAELPPGVADYLQQWSMQPNYTAMREEHEHIIASKKKYGSGPFVTVDAVVTARQHVLLVRRGRAPGKGLWAIPGGFLELHERVQQGALRELREETGLALADAELQQSLRGSAVFDHPERSLRGRTITHAHWFDLGERELPLVQGADDAAEARWFALSELPGMEAQLFEDHFHILNHFLSITA